MASSQRRKKCVFKTKKNRSLGFIQSPFSRCLLCFILFMLSRSEVFLHLLHLNGSEVSEKT